MELIDKNELINNLAGLVGEALDKCKVYEDRPKGKWVSVDWANEYFDCSICGNRRRGTSRYCEDCGTEMREVERVKGGLSERIVIKNDKWLQI